MPAGNGGAEAVIFRRFLTEIFGRGLIKNWMPIAFRDNPRKKGMAFRISKATFLQYN